MFGSFMDTPEADPFEKAVGREKDDNLTLDERWP